MANKTPQTLRGFRDFLPVQAKQRQWLKNKFTQTFELWGYQPIETPTVEPLELFEGEVGEDEKLFFKFEDPGKRKVALRYDQTVPTCRFLGQNYNELTFPFRRYQIQPVFRAEKPQKGRYREFVHADIDIFGVASPLADAEAIAVSLDSYRRIGFKNIKTIVNNRDLMKDVPYEAIVAIDKLEKIGDDGVIEDMIQKGIDRQQAEDYLNFSKRLQPDETVEIIFDYLKKSGFSEENYEFKPTLARSFSYSQGPIWEMVIPEYSAGSVGGGERYDGMVKRITGFDIPATGIAYGFDRTLEAAIDLGIAPQPQASSQVLVTSFDKNLIKNSIKVAEQIREAGFSTETYPDPEVPLPKQLKYANKTNIPWIIIIGEEEAKQNKVTLKNMESGDQERIKLTQVIEKLSL